MRLIFPYYKVYFKLDLNTVFNQIEEDFHTIKSILNENNTIYVASMGLEFPYYKVYFKQIILIVKTCEYLLFPYYKVYFKLYQNHHVRKSILYFHTIKSILNLV